MVPGETTQLAFVGRSLEIYPNCLLHHYSIAVGWSAHLDHPVVTVTAPGGMAKLIASLSSIHHGLILHWVVPGETTQLASVRRILGIYPNSLLHHYSIAVGWSAHLDHPVVMVIAPGWMANLIASLSFIHDVQFCLWWSQARPPS